MHFSHSFLLFGLLDHFGSVFGATTIFGGKQATFFPTDTPQSCLAAFNTSLSCDNTAQLLVKQTDWVGWNATNLTALCTSGCRSSLVALQNAVNTSCSSWAGGSLGSDKLDATTMMEFILYKYDMTCLADGATFCHIQRQNWDIPAMISANKATWPKNTNKTYYNWYYDPIKGSLPIDQNGTVLQPYIYPPAPNYNYSSTQKSAIDYVYSGGPKNKANYGWPEALESDEYPLEIQCSKCFLNRFTLGYTSRFGAAYDDITPHVWKNIQANCGIQQTLVVHPTLNVTGPGPNTNLTWTAKPTCDRSIAFTEKFNTTTSCQDFGLAQNFPTSSLTDMNNIFDCSDIGNGTFCAPLPCQVATVNYTMGVGTFQYLAEQQPNITLTQFMTWNPFAYFNKLKWGEVVCVGPPGGAYIPTTTVPPAYPTIFTTTAKPAVATAPGTIPNCGLWYNVTAGDECNRIAVKFSLTFDQLVNMNPSLDTVCSNLQAGVDYCVAPVNGTTVPTKTTTSRSSPTSTVIGGTTYPAAPAPTRAGTTAQCNTWYIVAGGNTCDQIDGKYGITFAQFRTWNTIIDSTCSNLQPDYAMCVSSPLKVAFTTTTSSSTSKPTTTTTALPSTCISTTTSTCTATPAPIQAGAVASCKKFYFTVTNDTCDALAKKYGFTTANFIKWNPAVGSTCNIWLSEWYCIGV